MQRIINLFILRQSFLIFSYFLLTQCPMPNVHQSNTTGMHENNNLW